MKNVTLSADEHLIDAAREKARTERTTLNQAFRDWLKSYTGRDAALDEYRAMKKRLGYASSGGRKFTRDEMNER